MRRKKALTQLIGIVLVALLAIGFTVRMGNAPLLGLDLEGGVSVVLSPQGSFTTEQIEQAIVIMNQRINALGVAEPDIHQQGDQIIVQIAGLKDADKDKAIKLVGQTAELRFRPVLAELGPEPETTVETTPGTTTPGTTAPPPSGTTPSADVGASNNSSTPPTQTPAAGENGMGLGVGESAAGLVRQAPPTTVTDAPAGTTPTSAAATEGTTPGSEPGTTVPAARTDANFCEGITATATSPEPTTLDEDNKPESQCKQVVLRGDPRTEGAKPSRYLLGPACSGKAKDSCLTGSALETARAQIDPQTGKWKVNPVFKGGAEGIDKFNALAAKCFAGTPNECPAAKGSKGRMAITLDGLVLSAPTINVAKFEADKVEISGSFNEETARNLATSLQYGALPVTLKQQSSEVVSATIGRDALSAGVAAGVVGLLLVAAYMVTFYRLLGVLAILKLIVEGALIWAIISYLGVTAGLALTLAGVTGIIVSVGVSLDSNVVYYEHLREDLHQGRTLRTSVDRSFRTAISTILKADGASLLGAVLLYSLAIGPVRGFAFYLGLSTVLDLISSYYYMRPVVYLATNSKLCRNRPGLFGLPVIAASDEPGSPVITRPSKAKARSGAGPRLTPASGATDSSTKDED